MRGVSKRVQLLPRQGWFLGLRRFLKNRVTLAVLAAFVLAARGAVVHDRIRQHAVASFVREMQQLRPGGANAAEVIAFAARHGLQSIKPSDWRVVEYPCNGTDCVFLRHVEGDPLISWIARHGTDLTGIKASWFDFLGLRPWGSTLSASLKHGYLQRVSSSFGTTQPQAQHPYEGWQWNFAAVLYAADAKDILDEWDVRMVGAGALNQKYLAWFRGSVFTVLATTDASAEDRDRAFSIDLGCLSKHPCHSWGAAVPQSWNRFCSEQAPDTYLYQECFGEQ